MIQAITAQLEVAASKQDVALILDLDIQVTPDILATRAIPATLATRVIPVILALANNPNNVCTFSGIAWLECCSRNCTPYCSDFSHVI